MTERTCREANSRDAVVITAMGRRILSEMGTAGGLPEPLTMVEVGRRLARYRGHGSMFLCYESRQAVGFAILEPDPSAGSGQAPQEPGCFSLGVWVLEPYRRRGIGRELALMAMEHAREVGCTRLRGTLPAGNETALSFFSEIGALASAVGGGMEYELPL